MGPHGAARFNLIGNIQPVREDSTCSDRVESSRSGATPHRYQASARVASLTLHILASNRPRPSSTAPDQSHCTRSVALHPIRTGVMPTDRVHRLPQQARPRTIPPHRPQPSASDAATRPRHAHPDSEREALHPLRRETPVTSRYTRSEGVQCLRIGCSTTLQQPALRRHALTHPP